MSTTIDSKVVEMKFDNSKFEKNVKESLGTLDKLKLALSGLTGKKASIDIDTSGTNAGISALSSSVQTITTHFSALETIAMGALMKIGSQAITAGEQLMKSLTVDQISAGYSKYDQKTASVQTLVNSTGKSVDEINDYLEKLMWYSDETSYSFTEMTSALAQMTSTGGNIENLIPTITGIANATAYAGKGANEFVHTIRNLGQSYNAGYLQLMDWKSLQLAGTASKQLTDELIRAGEELGKIKKGTVTTANFTETLKDKWADTEVMEKAFGRFAQASEDVYKLVDSGKFDLASEALASLGDGYDELALSAFRSAQEAKSFQEAIDATKDAVSSGWMTSFELIFGNYEQAKKLWTELANNMWDFFAGGAEKRNKILGATMGEGWDVLTSKLEDCGVSMDALDSSLERVAKAHNLNIDVIKNHYGSYSEWIKKTGKGEHYLKEALQDLVHTQLDMGKTFGESTKSLEDFQKVVDGVLSGKYGNGADRMKKLADAGYEYSQVQGLINKLWERGNGSFKDTKLLAEDLTGIIGSLSNAELESMGYTEEQAEALRNLAKEAEETGSSIYELIERLQKPSGRELLIDSLRNALGTIVDIVTIVKDSMSQIFPPKTEEDWYKLIEYIHKATKTIRNFFEEESNVDKLTRSFKGLFAIVDIISTLFGGAFKIGLEILKGVLKEFDINILDATASIGDMLVKLRDWVDEHSIVNKIVEKTVPIIVNFIKKIQNLSQEGKILNNIYKDIVTFMKAAKESFNEWVEGLKEADSIPEYIITTIAEGLDKGTGIVLDSVGNLGTLIIDTLKYALGFGGENEFYGAGLTAIHDFMAGFQLGGKELLDKIEEFAQDILDRLKKVNWSKVFAAVLGTSMVFFIAKLAKTFTQLLDIFEELVAPIQMVAKSIKKMFGSLATAIKKVGKATANDINATAILKFAGSLLVLTLALKVLDSIGAENIWRDIGALAALAGIIAMLTIVATACLNFLAGGGLQGAAGVAAISLLVLSMTGMVIALAVVMRLLSGMDDGTFKRSLKFVEDVLVDLGAVLLGIEYLASKHPFGGAKIAALSLLVTTLSMFFTSLAISMKIVGSMSKESFDRAYKFLRSTYILTGLLTICTTFFLKNKASFLALGQMMALLGLAFLEMSTAMKIVGSLNDEQFGKAMLFMLSMYGFVMLLMAVSRILKENAFAIEAFSDMMKRIGLAFLLAAVSVKIVGSMPLKDLLKGIIFLYSFVGFTALMAKATKKVKNDITSFSKSMGLLGLALLSMSLAMKIIGSMKPSEIIQGIVVVSVLSLFMGLLAKALSKIEKDIPKITGALMGVGMCILLLSVSIFLIGHMDTGAVIQGTLCLMALLTFIGIMLKLAGSIKGTKNALGIMIGFAVIIAVLAASIAILALIDDPEAIGVATTCMLLLVGMVGALIYVIGQMHNLNISVLVALGEVVLILVAIMVALKILAKEDPISLLSSAASISLILIAIAASIKIIDDVDISNKTLLTLGLMLVAVGAIAAILYLMRNINGITAIENAAAISIALIALSVTLKILASVGALAEASAPAILFLDILIADLAAMLVALGAVFKIPGLLDLMDIGILVMKKIGEMFGAVIGGFAEGVMSGLPGIGQSLSDFATNCEPFFEIMKKYDGGIDSVLKVLDVLTEIMKHQLWSILGDTFQAKALNNFKEQLARLVEMTNEFAEQSVDINDDTVKKIKRISEAAGEFVTLAKNMPTEGGLKAGILGDQQSLQDLSDGIMKLLPALISCSLNGSSVNSKTIKNIAESAGYLAEVQSKLPEVNGLKQSLLGQPESMEVFSSGIEKLGVALNKFNGKIMYANADNIDRVIKCAMKLGELANALPKKESVINSFFGGDITSIEEFGDSMTTFAGKFKDFNKKVEETGVIQTKRIENMSLASTQLADLALKLSEIDFSWWSGKKETLEQFGASIVSYVDSFKLFNDKVKETGTIQTARIETLTTVSMSIVELAKALAELDLSRFSNKNNTLSGFGESLGTLGDNLLQFYNSIVTISPSIFGSIVAQIRSLGDMCADLSMIDFQNVDAFKTSIQSLSELNIEEMIKTFGKEGVQQLTESIVNMLTKVSEAMKTPEATEGIISATQFILSELIRIIQESYNDFFQEALHVIDKIIAGMDSYKENIYSKVGNIASAAATKFKDHYTEFESAGEYAAKGLAVGISNAEGEALSAAQSLGEKVLAKLQSALQEHSPSKATEEMGKFFDMGFAQGIDKYVRLARESADNLGVETLNGIKNSTDMISSIVDWDMNPVITPTLDLSYVEAEASKMDGMFASTKIAADAKLQNGESLTAGSTINFTQNNYSPKALSRIDIYRQTRNQISQLKGAAY